MTNASTKSNLTLRILIGMGAGILIGVLLQMLYGDNDDFVISMLGINFSFHGFFVEGVFDIC